MPVVRDNVPAFAKCINFQYGRSMKATIYVWQTKGGTWYWSAMGNTGENKTEDLAVGAAREYIMNDYDPLTRKF